MAQNARVWTSFSRKRDGKDYNFQIQEVQSDRYEEIMDLFLKFYVPEEPVHKAAGVHKTKEALAEYRENYIDYTVSGDFQIDACFLEDSSGKWNIVGGSIMYLDQKNSPKWDVDKVIESLKSEEVKHFFRMVKYMSELYDEDFKEKYSYDLYFDDVGVVVHPDYRGLGIAGELFKSRVDICKEKGVPMTGAWMTSAGSQKAAVKLGWETALELNYKDLEKIDGCTFEGAPPTAKMMVTKV